MKGMRIPVGLVPGYLAAGKTAEEILAEFPEVTREQIAACLEVQRNSGVASAQSPGGASSFDGRTQRNLKTQPAVEHYRGKLFVVEVDRIRIRE